MKLFQCRPMDFLVKPITFPMVERTLGIVMKRELVNRKKITVKIDRENRVFFIKDILYFRSENKTVYMVMQSGETFKFSAKLDDKDYEKKQMLGNELMAVGDPVYKLSTDENWSVVIPIDAQRGAQIQQEDYVKVRFLKNQHQEI